jgi:conjugative transfer pilus assembly protein TraH
MNVFLNVFFLLALFPGSVLSSQSSLGNMIKHLGNSTNFNEGGSFQDQSTGHYTAGGMHVRQRDRTINPLNIRLPEVGGSCGSFDLRFGGISFMQSGEFIRMFKSVATGMPIYAMQLGLETYVPQIAGLMKTLQARLLEINKMMLGDCQARQQLMEGLLPTGSAMHEKVCLDMKQGGNFNNDYTGARERCMRKSERNEAAQATKDRHADLLIAEYNLIWSVMKKMPRYKDDVELAHMIMSLVGTVLSKKEGDDFKTLFLPPKADDDRFLDAYLAGGQTEIYVCGENTKCLDVDNAPHLVSQEASLSRMILKNIHSLKRKYLSEEEFSINEMAFLSDSVNLPIYKYIQISASSHLDYPLERSSQYLAMAILLKQFEDISLEIVEAVSVLESVQPDTTVTKEFKDRLELARTRLQQKMATLDSNEIGMLDKITRAKEIEMRANHDLEEGA